MNLEFPERINIHGYDKKYEQQTRLLNNVDILPENKKLIWDFVDFCKVSPETSDAIIVKYMFNLRRLAEIIKKPFKEADEKDITAALARLQEHVTWKGKPYSPHSIAGFRKAISKFWRWLYYDEYKGDAPPPIRRIKISDKVGKKEPEIYSKDEIKDIVEGMTTIRDKAFFICLYDLQCRVSELLTRQIKHIRYTDDGNIEILIEADKTKNSHWEPLYESTSYFNTWIRLHQARDNPNAPLWTIRKGADLVPLSYPTARKVFHNACKRQNIKRIRIHAFRKSKATHDLADGVPITYIESRGSWSKGSRALQDCYLLVQHKDKDNAYRKKYGMAVSNGTLQTTELKECVRCLAKVDSLSKFCSRCGMPLDKKTFIESKEMEGKLITSITPDMLSELVKRIVLQELVNKRNELSK